MQPFHHSTAPATIRRAIAVAVAAVVLAGSAFVAQVPAVGAQPTNQVSGAVPVVHIAGRGHGHGVGMSQWGAYTMANRGASAADIMAAFYPGTTLAEQGGEVTVGVHAASVTRVAFPAGGQIRSSRGDGPQAPGFPIQVAPGNVVEIARGPGGVEVRGGTVAPLSATSATAYSSPQDCLLICPPGGDPDPDGVCILCLPTTTVPPTTGPPTTGPPNTPPPSAAPPAAGAPSPGAPPAPAPTAPDQPATAPTTAAVWAVPAPSGSVTAVDRGRSYRGVFEVVPAPGGVRVRNHVDIEDYLKGMAEVPSTWPAAAVQAQAIAARTYALRAVAGGGELCDTESCQVYVGTSRETPGQNAAVDATRNVVVTHQGSLAATFYSATGGGFSATADEGFGSGVDVPYLQAAPYPDDNPQPYEVDVALRDVAARFGYAGTVTDVRVDRVGPSGRALEMSLVGSAGVMPIDPQDFRRKLGLRSTLFTVTTAEAATAPAPPPEAVDGDANDVVGDGVALRREPSATTEAALAGGGLGVGQEFDLATTTAGAARTAPALVASLALAGVTAGTVTGMRRRRSTMGPWRRRHH